MKAEDRKALFLKEFQDLLDKHSAEFELMDNGGAYHSSGSTANICMMGEWGDDCECTNEYVEFGLPTYMSPSQK